MNGELCQESGRGNEQGRILLSFLRIGKRTALITARMFSAQTPEADEFDSTFREQGSNCRVSQNLQLDSALFNVSRISTKKVIGLGWMTVDFMRARRQCARNRFPECSHAFVAAVD